MEQSNILEVTAENFRQVLLEQPPEQLVMVELWSARSEASVSLTPVLAQLAQEYASQLILARVDCDQQPQLAMQFGVQSIPTVALLKGGQPIDGFSGGLPAEAVREMLLRHLPKPEDELMVQARQQIQLNAFDTAYKLAKEALALASDRADLQLLMAEVYLGLGRLANARELLEGIGLADQDGEYKRLFAQLELAEEASDSPAIQQLQQALTESPDDLSLKMQLAVQYNQASRQEEALALLMEVLRADLGFEGARPMMLDMLKTLPAGDPLASKYRRMLYSLLH